MSDRGDQQGWSARAGAAARRRAILLALGAGLISAAVCVPGAAASKVAAPRAGVANASCADPVVTDHYDGFSVGVPRGWNLLSTGGLITVAPNFSGLTNGFVQTAYINHGQSVHTFFAKILAYLAKLTTAGSTTLSFHVTGTTSASASGHVGSVAVSGKATVRVIGVAARGHSQLGVVSGYFAPTSQVGSERRELASIGGCYSPARGTLFRFFKDSQFGYVMPLGWKPIEGQNLLFLHDGPNASANFLFAGPLLSSTTGVTSNQTLFTYAMKAATLTVGQMQFTTCSRPQTGSTGLVEQECFYYFLGHVGPKAVHGEARVISQVGGGDVTGILRFALTTPNLWNSLNGGLMWAALSIQHNFTGDLEEIQQAQASQAQFSQQVAGFDQALNGTDLVEDPSTGIQYEAPYSDYQNSGPNGAGYYIGNPGDERKLTLLTP